MSGPVSDDESSKHQMYAPKRLREQPRIPAASQARITSSPMSPSHAQVQGEWGETSALPSSGGGLENEVRRRLYEPEAVSQPQLQRRRYSVLTWISWLAIVASCTAVLITVIATTTRPLWQGSSAQRDAGSEAPQASRLSDRLAATNAPADSVTGIAAASGTQQPSSVQVAPAQLAPPARQFEQKSIDSPVQGVTDNEIRFGISAPFSGAAKELGQNMPVRRETPETRRTTASGRGLPALSGLRPSSCSGTMPAPGAGAGSASIHSVWKIFSERPAPFPAVDRGARRSLRA
jgi:hypothetical protein